MDLHAWIALGTLVVAAVLFLTKWLPLEIVALGIPIVLLTTGVIDSVDIALQGFGNHAVIALAAIFVVGAGLQESGVAALLARAVLRLGGRQERALTALIMVSVAVLSAFMSNAATVAVLIPAVLALCRRADIPPSRLLMPLSFAAILGGNLTLIGTAPNLLLSDYLQNFRTTAEQVGKGFGMFDFAIVGLPIVLVGTIFLVLFGGRLLPERRNRDRLREAHLPEDLAKSYGLTQQLFRLRVVASSKLVGQTVAEADLRERYGASLVLIERGQPPRAIKPAPSLVLQDGDELYVEGEDEGAWLLAEEEELRIGLAGEHIVQKVLDEGSTTLAEFTPAPRASVLGETLKAIDFGKQKGLNVVAIWRRGAPVKSGVADHPLAFGDTLLVNGPAVRIRALARDPDFLILSDQTALIDSRRAPLATGLLALAVVPPLFGWAPLAVSALTAAVLMVALRCVSREGLKRSIDWKVLSLIVGTMPLGHALEQQGLAARAADGLSYLSSGAGPPAVAALLFLAAAIVSVTSSNAAAAVILAPVAVKAAEGAGMEVTHGLLAVAYGCSCAFIVPFAHQCNLMVMGPGGYRPRDFALAGGAMSLVVIVTAVIGLALI